MPVPLSKVSNEIQDEEIDGGAITNLEESIKYHPGKHRADTARLIAVRLLTLLFTSIFLQYVGVILLEINGKHDAIESLEKIFNIWLPVVSGLTGSAVTYYFAKDK